MDATPPNTMHVAAPPGASAAAIAWLFEGRAGITLIVKATFSLVHGGRARRLTAASQCLALEPSELVPWIPEAGATLAGAARAVALRLGTGPTLTLGDSPHTLTPTRQRLPGLAGNERLWLQDLPPTLPPVETELPGTSWDARWEVVGTLQRGALSLALDTLVIDLRRRALGLVWRGVATFERAVAPPDVSIALALAGAAVASAGQGTRVIAPSLRENETAGTGGTRTSGTQSVTPELLAAARSVAPTPFAHPVTAERPVPGGPHGGAQHDTPSAGEPRPRGMPVPPSGAAAQRTAAVTPELLAAVRGGATPFGGVALPAPPRRYTTQRALAATGVLSEAEQARLSQAPVAPFVASGSTRGTPPSESERDQGAERPGAVAKGYRRSAITTGTLDLGAHEQERAAGRAPTPFSLAFAPGEASARTRARGQAPPRSERPTAHIPKRTTVAVPIVAPPHLQVATHAWQVRPPKDSLTLIVKGTFDLVPGAPARPRVESEPPTGDVHQDEDRRRSLRYASDFAVFKPQADVTVTGHAHAARGAPTIGMRVSFTFGAGPGRIERGLTVVGDRVWKKGMMGLAETPSEPEPFRRLPLVYERAFGGPGLADNPLGTGHKSAAPASGTGARLPNLEEPQRPIRTPGDTREPACFAPLAPSFAPRCRGLGSYGRGYRRGRWPYFPEDFDWQCQQHAPHAQRTAYLRGDEPFELVGMHPEHAALTGSLPGLRVRAFAERRAAAGGGFSEVPLVLDTAAFDVDAMKVNLVWRGLVEVSDDEASELALLFVHAEALAAPAAPLDALRGVLLAALQARATTVFDEPDPAANDTGPAADDGGDGARAHARAVADSGARQAELAKLPAAFRADDAGALPEAPAPPAAHAVPPRDPALRALVIARLAAGESLEGLNLAGANLSGLNFAGRSLARAVLKDASLTGAVLTGANLRGAGLARAVLEGAQCDGACFAEADLSGARLAGASLRQVTLDDADMSRIAADGVDWSGAQGSSASFVGASLRRGCFAAATLPAANFSGARLDAAVFTAAVLAEVRLYDARAPEARFDGARMPGARADGAKLRGATLRGVDAERSVWEGAVLEGAAFQGALLRGAGLARTRAAGANFATADLRGARLLRARLPGAVLRNANLMQASLERADLSRADLRSANLFEAETWKAVLEGAELEGALVTRSKLEEKMR